MAREMTPEDVEERLEDAALTLRRLPNPPGSGPKGYGSSWPEYIRDARHAYGYHGATMKITPSAADIQRMEESIEWLRLISPEDARIVWMRAERRRWRQIAREAGVARQTAWRRWAAAIYTITKHINGGKAGRKSRARTQKSKKQQKNTKNSQKIEKS